MTESERPAGDGGDNSAENPAIEPTGSHGDVSRIIDDAMLEKPEAVALSKQNIKNQEEHAAEKLDQVADAWRAIVRQLWNDAAKAMSRGDAKPADGVIDADEGFGDFADWLVARVDWREAILPRTAGDSRSGEAFEGPLELVMLKVRVGAENLQGKPLDLANFFRGAVAATLRRQETEGLATREARADMVSSP